VRAVFCESEEQAHVLQGIDVVLRKQGGTAGTWRFDRMAALVYTHTGQPLPQLRAAAKYYGVRIAVCPPRRGNRKGVVESRNHFLAQRWWRTADVADVAAAQVDLDRFCVRTADALPRGETTVRVAARAEQLMTLPPAPYPVTVVAERRVDRAALVSFRGNQYAVSPGLVGRQVAVRHRVDDTEIEVVAPDGTVVARHRRAPDGAHAVVRTPEQRAELERVVLSSFTTAQPCVRKANLPPSEEARRLAGELAAADRVGEHVIVDLDLYRQIAEGAS
jgi:hypothetical protein